MKKLISLVLVAVMILAFAACGQKPADPTPTPASTPTPATDTNTPDNTGDDTPDSTGSDTAWNPDNIGSHTFILAHGLAETSMTGVQYHEFALAVDELSGGKIKIEERIGGSLVTDTETLDALLDGTIDLCHSMGSYVSGTITDISPLTIAGYYGGSDWPGFAEQTYDLIGSIYADYGIKYLGALAQGNSAIVCTEKLIKSPGEVKGLTFRASGTWVSKTVGAWGGSAVTIGLADLADSFSKKTVQGVATGLNIIVPFKLYEVADNITYTTMSEGFAALLMSENAWNSLNADEQALITEAGKIFTEKSYSHAVEFMSTYQKTIEDSGRNEIHYLTDAEQAEFVTLAMGLYDEMLPELGSKGVELVDLIKDIAGN